MLALVKMLIFWILCAGVRLIVHDMSWVCKQVPNALLKFGYCKQVFSDWLMFQTGYFLTIPKLVIVRKYPGCHGCHVRHCPSVS